VVVGAITSPLCTFVLEWIRNRQNRKLDDIRKARLIKILKLQERKWRELGYLAKAVGATEDETQRLLLEIGARQSLNRTSTKWALISRSPFPDDVNGDDVDEPASN
jgi:hypothetical protein